MADPFFSELKYTGNPNLDFVEIAVPTGTNVSNFRVVVYNSNGKVRTTNALGSPVSTVAGFDIYLISAARTPTFNGLVAKGAVALSNNGTLLTNNGQNLFFSFNNGPPVTATAGPANGLTSTQIGQAASNQSLQADPNAPTSFFLQTTPNPGTIPCFVTGALIQTDRGHRRVETLLPGDLVRTKGNGLRPLRWRTCRRKRGAPWLVAAPLGGLHLSPNHRVLLKGAAVARLFGDPECLAAVKHLGRWDRAVVTEGPAIWPITYHHLAFDNHEIIAANGLWVESLYLGEEVDEGLCPEERADIIRALRHASGTDNPGPTTPARRILRGYEANALSRNRGVTLADLLVRASRGVFGQKPVAPLAAQSMTARSASS